MAERVTITDLNAALAAVEAKLEAQTLRMTFRLGAIMVAAMAALAVVQHFI